MDALAAFPFRRLQCRERTPHALAPDSNSPRPSAHGCRDSEQAGLAQPGGTTRHGLMWACDPATSGWLGPCSWGQSRDAIHWVATLGDHAGDYCTRSTPEPAMTDPVYAMAAGVTPARSRIEHSSFGIPPGRNVISASGARRHRTRQMLIQTRSLWLGRKFAEHLSFRSVMASDFP